MLTANGLSQPLVIGESGYDDPARTEAVVGPTAIASKAAVRQDCAAMNRIELHPVVGFRLVSKLPVSKDGLS
jgi:hypothetical protein